MLRLLPAALAHVEAMQGRPFRRRVFIGVYVTPEAFAAANGTGVSGAVGANFLGRVILSPSLFSARRARLPAILTHELSHAHLRSWMSELTFIALPNWFKEGLAVMMQAILDGRPFAEAVETGYQTDLEALWLRFVKSTEE